MQGFKNITVQNVKLQVSRGGRVYYSGKELKAHKQGKYAIVRVVSSLVFIVWWLRPG